MNGNWRHVLVKLGLVTLGAAVVGALAFAGPAAADVTVSPSQAARGGSAELTFKIPEERPGAYTTKVELIAPTDTPVAEIYPLSVDNWAPLIGSRKLDQALELIHGTVTDQVVSGITWTYVADAPPADPQAFDLRVALGPMPDADAMVFTLVQTYSDGTVVRYADQPGPAGEKADHPAPTLTLAGDAPEGATHGGDGHDSGDDAVAVSQSTKDDGYGVLGAFLIVGLALGLGIDGWFIVRAIRRHSLAKASTAK